MRRSSRRTVDPKDEDVPPPLPVGPVADFDEDGDEEEGIISQEEDDEEGVTYEEDEGTDEEGLEANWEAHDDDDEEPEEDEDEEDMDEKDETGSMSPTDAMAMDTMSEEVGGKSMTAGNDPICYHCGVPLVEPPLRLPAEDSITSPKISIPLHCEVCVRGIHSQCHLSLGGSLPTQEESFVCFHCRTSQHGKYEMKAAERVKIPVGPTHQAPIIPTIYFDCPTKVPLSVARNRFVQLWSADAAKSIIPEDKRIQEYLHKAAQCWPDKLRVNSSGGSLAPGSVRRLYLGRAAGPSSNSVLNHYWAPFSPDFAMTILHRCNYNSDQALKVVKSPLLKDCFTAVCNPPTKPYYNKWKPKDRRWRMMKIPFPPSRIEAPDVTNIYATTYEGDGPRLRSRRHFNYNY